MKKVCIIGAGISGIVTAKALLDKNIDFDWFEKDDSFGGVWYYKDERDRFSIYNSCHSIACNSFMSFRDFPIPKNDKEYMRHDKYLAYLKKYIEYFSLEASVQFNCEVEKINPLNDGSWEIEVKTPKGKIIQQYQYVVVATGLYHIPKQPTYSGTFEGKQIHSAYYRKPHEFVDENVLIIGLGNSGADISCDLVSTSRSVTLSSRESGYVIPKYILGIPFLKWYSAYEDYLPFFIRQWMLNLLLLIGRGRIRSYKFPKPFRKPLIKNPVVSSTLLEKVASGDIEMKNGISHFDGSKVYFLDGSNKEFDTIIYATGYQVEFPFFSDDLLTYQKGKFENYMNVVNLHHENLYFVGMVDPLGTLPAILELQAKWVAQLIFGQAHLPTIDHMKKAYDKYDRKFRKRFKKVDSNEPIINIDYFRYQHQINKKLKKAKRKAHAV